MVGRLMLGVNTLYERTQALRHTNDICQITSQIGVSTSESLSMCSQAQKTALLLEFTSSHDTYLIELAYLSRNLRVGPPIKSLPDRLFTHSSIVCSHDLNQRDCAFHLNQWCLCHVMVL